MRKTVVCATCGGWRDVRGGERIGAEIAAQVAAKFWVQRKCPLKNDPGTDKACAFVVVTPDPPGGAGQAFKQ